MVLAGVLDDDHGIDYGRIPFDLATPEGRETLWDELAACVVSCAYLHRPLVSVYGWFTEQLEIQPVFYGMEGDPPGFFAAVKELSRRDAMAAAAMLERAYDGVAALARAGGARAEVAQPARRFTLEDLWPALGHLGGQAGSPA